MNTTCKTMPSLHYRSTGCVNQSVRFPSPTKAICFDLNHDTISPKKMVRVKILRSRQRPNYVEIQTECHFMSTYIDTGTFYRQYCAF